MKKISIILILAICCGNCQAQTDTGKSLCAFIIPSEVDQELIYYLVKKYQPADNEKNKLTFFYSTNLVGRAGIINVPIAVEKQDSLLQLHKEQEKAEGIIEHRLNLLEEIAEYHKTIITTSEELQKLKQDREMILKKLQLMKSLLKDRKPTKLSRIEE